jgi:hypothetical protein
MYNPHMTENELRQRLADLEKMARSGELTPTSAREMGDVKLALREITMAKRASIN